MTSWVTMIWSMGAAVCLPFAAGHLLTWFNSRDARANLLFAIGACAVAALTMLALGALRAETAAAYGEAIRWMHVAVAVVMVALVWFVRAYLRAGRLWLAWAITVLRGLLNGLEAVQEVADERRTLTIEAPHREDGWVEVAVRDRGPGFAAGQAAAVFEPFVSTKAGGTGLGFAISRTIIDAHGGWISAENAPEGGAIARFTLEAA